MNRKVIYVSHAPLDAKIRRDWYIGLLLSRGASVEYWDLVRLLFGAPDRSTSEPADYLRTPTTYEELEALLELPENKNAQYVMLASYEGRTVKLFRLLTKHNCRMLFLACGGFPPKHGGMMRRNALGLLSNPWQKTRTVLSRLKSDAYRRLNLIKPFDLAFVAGHALMAADLHAVKKVAVNLADYDHYMTTRVNRPRIVEGRYAAFLDIYLPYQSDLSIARLSGVTPEKYYGSLNRFFSLVERKHGVKVVIAAHPKAKYGDDVFQGRAVYGGRTPELVADAEFVISHHSTSNAYAVLNGKPIVFVYTDEMGQLYRYSTISHIRGFATYLHASIYNIDRVAESDQVVIRDVDRAAYDAYKYAFITTPETEHTTTEEIFWREITSAEQGETSRL